MKTPGVLAGCDVFAHLNHSALRRLSHLGWQIRGKKQSPVFYPGDSSNLVYVVQEGRVRISCDTNQNRRITLEIFEQGDLFGELALADEQPRVTLAQAIEPSTFFVMSNTRLQQFLEQYPSVFRKFLGLLAERRRKVQEKLKHLLFQDAAGRLAYILIDLFHEQGNPLGELQGSEISFSHQELADFCGLARPTTTNLLNTFESRELIRLGQRSIVLLNPAALKSIYQDSS